MPLSAGTRLGVYEVIDSLGAGGMGEVYRARDSKLGRSVAVKVLPDALASDPERVARFEREAKALAALNHPHIAALFGLEQAEGRHFLVMELVEGETLAERIACGPLALEGALKLALQIAEALEAAHEKGIVHRDLKPANVKITPEEKVKVLDFGLAKAMEPVGQSGTVGPAAFTHSPTLSMMATQAGVILGTAAYMSPEQAKGFPADQRSDVFSFGVVLYEMLTGRQPFQGETAPETLASVLIRDADLNRLPPNLHPRLTDLLKRCLHKNPKQRWQAIGDVRAELETIAADPRGATDVTQVIVQQPPFWKRAIPVVVASILVGLVAGATAWMLKPSPPLTIARFPITLREGQQFTNTGRQLVAISPDGTQIVYVANQRLYLRAMSDLEARPIAGTEVHSGVLHPAFSPDGRSIAFWALADTAIKRIALSGGAPVTICQTQPIYGMSWGDDGILFGQAGKGVMRVSPNGGKPEVIVATRDIEQAHGPQMLPDGRTVLFTLATAAGGAERWDRAQIVAQSLKTGERKTLIDGGSDARYLPTGHLVYALGGVLFATPVDLRRLQVVGGPVPIVEGVRRAGGATGTAHFSVSATGSLVYVPGSVSTATTQADLALFDRKGGIEPLKLPSGPYEVPRVSPDGKQIAFGTDDGKEAIVWIYDLTRTSSMRRLTFGGRNRFPIWSADGQRVAFQSDREGDLAIFWQRADGTGTAERLTKPDQNTSHMAESWAPSGERFLFAVTKGSVVSLWTFSLQDKKATPFDAVESGTFIGAVFSPDGRWVAYSTRESGRASNNVYVQPFPPTGAKYQISANADDGHHPVWSRDGTELFFVPGPGRFVVSSITTKPSFAFGNAVAVPRQFFINAPQVVRTYDIAPDGRFIGVLDSATTAAGGSSAAQIEVVLNWFEDLKQRVPSR